MVPHYWELPPTGHYGQQAVNGQQGLWSQSWIQSSLLLSTGEPFASEPPVLCLSVEKAI